MDTLRWCLKCHIHSFNVLKTEISVFSQLVIFKEIRKGIEHTDGIEVASMTTNVIKITKTMSLNISMARSLNPWERIVFVATYTERIAWACVSEHAIVSS
jgi:hypothetical protein